jgi:hypothetical protein
MRRLGTLGAFVKRDFLIETSYRTSFLLQFFGIFFSVLIWRLISKVVTAPKDTPGLEGMDYFAYVLVGLAFTTISPRPCSRSRPRSGRSK